MSKPIHVLFTTALLLGMSGCLSNDERSSNLSPGDPEATTSMETRLKDSARVNLIVSKLDLALRPVSNILADVEKILKVDEQEKVREKIAQIRKLSISVIRHELDRLKRGLVEKNLDGTWKVEKNLNWPFSRDTIPGLDPSHCATSSVALTGERADARSENVSLLLDDCALPGPTAVIRANITDDLEIQAELNLGGLDQMLKPGAAKGPCTIRSMPGSGVQLDCEPFVETSGGLAFEFERISYSSSNAGEMMDFSLKIGADGTHDNDWQLVRATVRKSIGQKTRVKIDRL